MVSSLTLYLLFQRFRKRVDFPLCGAEVRSVFFPLPRGEFVPLCWRRQPLPPFSPERSGAAVKCRACKYVIFTHSEHLFRLRFRKSPGDSEAFHQFLVVDLTHHRFMTLNAPPFIFFSNLRVNSRVNPSSSCTWSLFLSLLIQNVKQVCHVGRTRRKGIICLVHVCVAFH